MDDFIKFEFTDDDESETIEEPEVQNSWLDKDYLSVDPLTPLPIPPWVGKRKTYSRDYVKMLNQEIRDYIDYVRPTIAEHQMRIIAVKRLETVVKSLWKQAKVCNFGSFETQLYLPSSDLDCVIIDSSLYTPQCLFELRNGLEKDGIATRIDVPIVKYIDSFTNYNVDVSFNVANGVEAAKIVKQSVEDKKIGNAVRILMLLLKQFLVQRHLNEVFTGGLGRVQTGEIDPEENIGVLLIEFFELYGKNFNYANVGIKFQGDKSIYFPRERAAGYSSFGKPSPLQVMDPQDASNDVTRGSYNYQVVKNAFGRAYMTLTSMIGAGYERKFSNRKIDSEFSNDERYMITMLGSILTISRSVMEHRDYIETRYEHYSKGDWSEFGNLNNLDATKPAEVQKRKRDDDSSGSDYLENLQGNEMLHMVKRARNNSARKSEDSLESGEVSDYQKPAGKYDDEDELVSQKRGNGNRLVILGKSKKKRLK
ncbi:Non-canonical poly(A) RNA polymerase papd5 [Terramyces sp. JEL0728]|nr:Non-canonical poly(A) RNA polymerase papd5 [Terramyces sp. JEL0728]